MSKVILARLELQFGARILASSDFRGDEVAVVAPSDWLEVAQFLRDDPALELNHYIDLTAVDYPEREPQIPRFDIVLFVRSLPKTHRIRLKTQIGERDEIDSLTPIWPGANWAEREVFDMFGIRFRGHPDLRRILLYEEFVGYPLRKDYPIERTQPLTPYRDVTGVEKLPPFGVEEGTPFGRIQWRRRLEHEDRQVSPAIGLQTGQRMSLNDSEVIREDEYQQMPPTANVTAPKG